MLVNTPNGLYCPAGDFHVDPRRGVERALITHAHSDHARSGSQGYWCAQPGLGVLRERLKPSAAITGVAYGQSLRFKDVQISFHPAGHVLGSAQIRLEHRGEVWVVSGDYKLQPDPTCTPFEPVRCHTFITECTFGLPIYQWPTPESVFHEIRSWWQSNSQAARTSVLHAYSLGKAQRLLSGLDPAQGPLLVHSSILPALRAYRAEGICLPEVERLSEERLRTAAGRALVITPPQADEPASLVGPGGVSRAFASGWMHVRGGRQGRGSDTGFVLSDHADWPGLTQAIQATNARRILVTHGSTRPLVRWLREKGLDAASLEAPARVVEEGSAPS